MNRGDHISFTHMKTVGPRDCSRSLFFQTKLKHPPHQQCIGEITVIAWKGMRDGKIVFPVEFNGLMIVCSHLKPHAEKILLPALVHETVDQQGANAHLSVALPDR